MLKRKRSAAETLYNISSTYIKEKQDNEAQFIDDCLEEVIEDIIQAAESGCTRVYICLHEFEYKGKDLGYAVSDIKKRLKKHKFVIEQGTTEYGFWVSWDKKERRKALYEKIIGSGDREIILILVSFFGAPIGICTLVWCLLRLCAGSV